MSLKENIDMVKEELNQEEKLFESAVKIERFVKTYKMPLISIFGAILFVILGDSVYQANLASAKTASNDAYTLLLKDPSDAKAASVLEDNNPSLYNAWKLQIALKDKDIKALESLKISSSDIVADLASYELATIQKDKAALNEYSLEQDAVLKDLAILNEAVLLMKEGKIEEAHTRLKMIDTRSPLHKTVNLLEHYGVK
ncbi:MAG TPA: hypothetical protein EYO73_12450 [Sulfurimonas sp.]|nr:hypothetical protein [Sulfurimonas sp.]